MVDVLGLIQIILMGTHHKTFCERSEINVACRKLSLNFFHHFLQGNGLASQRTKTIEPTGKQTKATRSMPWKWSFAETC